MNLLFRFLPCRRVLLAKLVRPGIKLAEQCISHQMKKFTGAERTKLATE